MRARILVSSALFLNLSLTCVLLNSSAFADEADRAPASSQPTKTKKQKVKPQPAPQIQYEVQPVKIVGGVVGTLIGFGTGHIIQGRYWERGWIFTITDLVTEVLWVGSHFGDCASGHPDCHNTSMANFSTAALAVSRVWEAYDLFTHLKDPQAYVTVILPRPQENRPPLLAAGWSF